MRRVSAQEDIRLNADSVTYPVLVMHGTGDRLSMIDGSEAFFNAAKRCVVATQSIHSRILRTPAYCFCLFLSFRTCSTDKSFKKYWNFSHELFNEPNHMQVWRVECFQSQLSFFSFGLSIFISILAFRCQVLADVLAFFEARLALVSSSTSAAANAGDSK